MHRLSHRYLLLQLLAMTTLLWAGEWQSIAPLNIQRGGAAAINYKQKIYVFGGISLNNSVLKNVELYDPFTNTWDTTSVPNFSIPRYNASVVVYDNRIYLIGGRDNQKVFNEVEVYDPEQNSWSVVQELLNGRESLAAVVFNGRIYVIGGQKANYNLVDEVEWYNKGEDDWLTAIFNLPFPRAAYFSTVVQDTFFMFGGYYYGLTKTTYKCHADLEGYYWFTGPQLGQGRAYGATAQIDSLIYLIGGETSSGKTAITEIYNIYSKAIKNGPSLTSARSGMASTAMGDTIFVIGGFDNKNDQPMDLVDILIETPTSSHSEHSQIPVSSVVIKGYPNPFNDVIKFEIAISKMDDYRIEIFDIRGQRITELHNGLLGQGNHNFYWNGSDFLNRGVSSGIYILSLYSNSQLERYKIIYVK